MKPLTVAFLGVFLGIAGYAACALIFWYGRLSPYFAAVITIVGVISAVVAVVSAIAAVIGLIVKLSNKLDRAVGRNG